MLCTRVSIRLAFVAFLLTSCGMPTNEKSVKNFVLSCMNCDSSLHDGFSRIVHQYNSEAGFEALQYTTNSEDANSPVYLTQGLNMREGKVGWAMAVRDRGASQLLAAAEGPSHGQLFDAP